MSEQQVEDISFKVEFPLSDDSVLNKTDEELAAEIQTELFEIYDKLNPFEDGETTVEVKIVNLEVCKPADEIQTKVENEISSKQTCKNYLTNETRRRRDVSSSTEDGIVVTEKKSIVECSFESTGNSTINWSEETKAELTNDIQALTNKEGLEIDGIDVDKTSGQNFLNLLVFRS